MVLGIILRGESCCQKHFFEDSDRLTQNSASESLDQAEEEQLEDFSPVDFISEFLATGILKDEKPFAEPNLTSGDCK